MLNARLLLSLLMVLLAGFNISAPMANAQQHVIELDLRFRQPIDDDKAVYAIDHRNERWQPERTAVIVCDMWDAHHCLNAVRRETEMAPRMNLLLHELREQGVFIIHAPSSCMNAYEDHPGRRLAQQAPKADNLPSGIGEWCDRIPSEEQGVYPVDQSDGGEDDDPQEHARWHEQLASQGRNPRSPWTKQIDLLDIEQGDAISDNGVEIWNLLESRDINNVMLVGVHTNMCVLGRPFGLRQMAKNGKNVVLVRDLTDTMYNPKMWPYVSHVAGTDRIVEHIEKFVCPTITSDQVLGGRPFRFSSDQRPHVVCLLAEREYDTRTSIPRFIRENLPSTFRYSFLFDDPKDSNQLLGWREIEQADVLLVSVRRRALPASTLQLLQQKLRLGTPVIGIRTASHAFSLNGGTPPEGHREWPDFDQLILGGNYHMHHGNKGPDDPKTFVWVPTEAQENPLVSGLTDGEIQVTSWLYKTQPLAAGTTVLLMGRVGDRKPHEPVAWTHINPYGARVFYTSMGHTDDFDQPFFVQMLSRSMLWAAGLPHDLEVPREAKSVSKK